MTTKCILQLVWLVLIKQILVWLVNNTSSLHVKVSHRVPQGPVLGPVPVNIFTATVIILCLSLEYHDPFFYVGDLLDERKLCLWSLDVLSPCFVLLGLALTQSSNSKHLAWIHLVQVESRNTSKPQILLPAMLVICSGITITTLTSRHKVLHCSHDSMGILKSIVLISSLVLILDVRI